MDFTEVTVKQDKKSKMKKSKKLKKNTTIEEGGAEGGPVEGKMEQTDAAETSFPPAFSLSDIKNKQRRHMMFMKFKQEKRKVNTHTKTHTYTSATERYLPATGQLYWFYMH